MRQTAIPADWKSDKPWSCCFRLLALDDDEFWSDQVDRPAAAWTAAGGKGVLLAPAERERPWFIFLGAWMLWNHPLGSQTTRGDSQTGTRGRPRPDVSEQIVKSW